MEDFGSNISDTFRRKTILSDIANRGKNHQKIFTELANVYEWFTNIILIFPASKYTKINEIVANDTIKEFYSDLLSYFDTGIESVEGSHEEIDFDKILENTPKEKQEKIKLEILNKVSKGPAMFRINKKVYTLNMDETGNIIYNKILLNHGNMEDLFEYADESDGTKRLFDLIPLLYTSSANSVILIDEIDRSLHTNLTRQFLTLFYAIADRKSNQILATTHDSNLLDLDMVRQDEIWFIEREKDHSSKIYSLNKYRTRFDNKVNKEYLLGRYGAIPVFQNCSLVMEDEHE